MQSRMELDQRANHAAAGAHKALSRAERAVCDWAVVDDHQAVLEIGCEQGQLLRHLDARYHLRTCGLCFDRNHTVQIREALPEAEIMFSAGGDIPWQDASFHSVLAARGWPDHLSTADMLSEIHRVLRPGGQLVMALPQHGGGLRGVVGLLGVSAGDEQRARLLAALESGGFEDVSYRRSRLGFVSVLARKTA